MRHRIDTDTDTDTFYMYIYIHTYIAPPKKKTGSIYHCFRYEVHQVLFVFLSCYIYIYMVFLPSAIYEAPYRPWHLIPRGYPDRNADGNPQDNGTVKSY